MDTPSADHPSSDPSSDPSSGSSSQPSSGPAPDSPFDTSPSEQFQGPASPSSGPFAGGGSPFGAEPQGGNDPFGAPPASVSDDWSTLAIPASIAVDMARDWVRERQTPVMLGTFAVGVFVSVLSR